MSTLIDQYHAANRNRKRKKERKEEKKGVILNIYTWATTGWCLETGKCTPSVWFLVFSLVRPFNALQNHNEYGALIHFKSQTCTCYVFNFHWPNCTLSIPPKRNQIVKFVPRLSNFQKFDAERLRKYKLASGHIQILNSKILCSMNPSTSLWGRHQPAEPQQFSAESSAI